MVTLPLRWCLAQGKPHFMWLLNGNCIVYNIRSAKGNTYANPIKNDDANITLGPKVDAISEQLSLQSFSANFSSLN